MEDKNDLRRSGRNTRRVARRREDLSAKPRRVQTAVCLLSRLRIKFCDATTGACTTLARTSPANFPTPHVDSSFGPRKPPGSLAWLLNQPELHQQSALRPFLMLLRKHFGSV